jgi:hypothetical protein
VELDGDVFRVSCGDKTCIACVGEVITL